MKQLLSRFPYHIVAATLLVVGALLVMAGLLQTSPQQTASPPRPKISFAAYGGAEQRKIIRDTAQYFERDFNCDVQVYCFPTLEDLQSRILAQYSAGDPFDVFYINNELLTDLSRSRKLASLDEVVKQRKSEGDEFIKAALSTGQVGGVQYALPTGMSPFSVYYNKTLLAKAGTQLPQAYLDAKEWDLDHFAQYCRSIKEKTGGPALAIDTNWQALFGFVRANGGNLLGASQEGSIELDANGYAAMDTLQGLLSDGAVVCANSIQRGASTVDLFRSGTVPMVMGSIENIRNFYETMNMDWDIAPLPLVEGGFSDSILEIPQIAVASDSDNLTLAQSFADFYVSSFGQKTRLEQGEMLLSSLDMVFYTSLGDVRFPDHSNYLFFAADNGTSEANVESYQKNRLAVLDDFNRFIQNELPLKDWAAAYVQ